MKKDCETCLYGDVGMGDYPCSGCVHFYRWEPVPSEPESSPQSILEQVASLIKERGSERDQEDGERSMARAVEAFNALTAHKLSVEEGWEFMVLLKLARKHGGAFKLDDYLDGTAYMALMTEEALKERERG